MMMRPVVSWRNVGSLSASNASRMQVLHQQVPSPPQPKRVSQQKGPTGVFGFRRSVARLWADQQRHPASPYRQKLLVAIKLGLRWKFLFLRHRVLVVFLFRAFAVRNGLLRLVQESFLGLAAEESNRLFGTSVIECVLLTTSFELCW